MVETKNQFESTLDFARKLDRADDLAGCRDRFHMPVDAAGQPHVYLVGNSLGLQPKTTSALVGLELEKWQRLGVRGHFEGDYPWMPYHEYLAEPMAAIVGAQSNEVVVMNSLTTNLHLMMASFYQPDAKRHKILIEEHAFPSDHYAVESQIRYHGRDPQESLQLIRPRAGEDTIRGDDLLQLIEQEADQLALILLPGVQYYTGQYFDLAAISELAHQREIVVGFDLAHAAGNVPVQLHDWNVDFAVWCNYKYLNSGPGSVGGCFVHERHVGRNDLPRLSGWWGHDKSTRFLMQNQFTPIPTAEGWQLSNPPILSLAAIRASLAEFQHAGGMQPLRAKSLRLTGYFEWLLAVLLADDVRIVTPRDAAERGCQLSLAVETRDRPGKEIHAAMESANLMTDWREPNVIRAAPVPLYNSFEDVYRFVHGLKCILAER